MSMDVSLFTTFASRQKTAAQLMLDYTRNGLTLQHQWLEQTRDAALDGLRGLLTVDSLSAWQAYLATQTERSRALTEGFQDNLKRLGELNERSLADWRALAEQAKEPPVPTPGESAKSTTGKKTAA